MYSRRVTADPDMERWSREMIRRPRGALTKDVNIEKKTFASKNESALAGTECCGETQEGSELDKQVKDCMWQGESAHKGLSHAFVRDKYWKPIHGRTYLRCYPDVYEYVACIYARSIRRGGDNFLRKRKQQSRSGDELDTTRQRLISTHRTREARRGASKKSSSLRSRESIASRESRVAAGVTVERIRHCSMNTTVGTLST